MASAGVRRDWWALLVAFGIDDFGSGLFLPLTVVFVTRVVGLPLSRAGVSITVGTVVGLGVPAIGGLLVERFGARRVVITAQLIQALGAGLYLVSVNAVMVASAAVLVAAGQQLFYSSLFMLISQVAGEGPKDRAFTVVAMIRGGAFAAGALTVGVLLSSAGPASYRWGLIVDVATFVFAAVVLALGVRAGAAAGAPTAGRPAEAPRGVLRDGRYLLLIAVSALFVLAPDFFLVGVPVFALDVLSTPAWLPGALLGVLTVVGCAAAPLVLRRTGHWSRVRSLRLSAVAIVVWCATGATAVLLPPAWRTGYLIAGVLVLTAAQLLSTGRLNALAEASAPPHARARYLAAFQYAFTVAGIAAPTIVSLFAINPWLPWLVIALAAGASLLGLRALATRLPHHATSAGIIRAEVTR